MIGSHAFEYQWRQRFLFSLYCTFRSRWVIPTSCKYCIALSTSAVTAAVSWNEPKQSNIYATFKGMPLRLLGSRSSTINLFRKMIKCNNPVHHIATSHPVGKCQTNHRDNYKRPYSISLKFWMLNRYSLRNHIMTGPLGSMNRLERWEATL